MERVLLVINSADANLTIGGSGSEVTLTDSAATIPVVLNTEQIVSQKVVDKTTSATAGVVSLAFTAADTSEYWVDLVQPRVNPYEEPSVVRLQVSPKVGATAADIATQLKAQITALSNTNQFKAVGSGSASPVAVTASTDFPVLYFRGSKNITPTQTTAGVRAYLLGKEVEKELNCFVYANVSRPVATTAYNVLYLTLATPNGVVDGDPASYQHELVILIDGKVSTDDTGKLYALLAAL